MTAKTDEITGRLSRITWQAEDGSACIVAVALPSGTNTTAKGPCEPDSPPKPGLTYRWWGRWEDHPRYGRQFAWQTYALAEPHDARGVIAYLVATVPGVGEIKAQKLWDLFGSAAVQRLREQPTEAVKAGILTESQAREAAQALHNEGAFQAVKIDLLSLFAGRGFPRTLIAACLRTWGGRAAERVRRNPFLLLVKRLPGAGFKRCDSLYTDLGHPPGRLKRQALCAWNWVRSDSTGHTWFPAEQVGEAVRSAIGEHADPLRALRLAIRSGLLARRREHDGVWLAEGVKAKHEAVAAGKLRELSRWTRKRERPCDGVLRTPSAAATGKDGSTDPASTPITSTSLESVNGPSGAA